MQAILPLKRFVEMNGYGGLLEVRETFYLHSLLDATVVDLAVDSGGFLEFVDFAEGVCDCDTAVVYQPYSPDNISTQ